MYGAYVPLMSPSDRTDWIAYHSTDKADFRVKPDARCLSHTGRNGKYSFRHLSWSRYWETLTARSCCNFRDMAGNWASTACQMEALYQETESTRPSKSILHLVVQPENRIYK